MDLKKIWRPTVAVLCGAFLSTSASAGVMMEGFYWNVPNGWYHTMTAKAQELRNMADGYGIDRLWFPPPSKAQSGPNSMGYDPHDYFDLGAYDQDGSVATRFGTQQDLKEAIAVYRSAGIACMADIVLNHRSGGLLESNPNSSMAVRTDLSSIASRSHGYGGKTGATPKAAGTTWTDFSNTASGRAQWHYNEFHPSTFEAADEGSFGDMPDICYVTGNSPGHAYYDIIQWGQWLQDPKNAGVNGGWRFDYTKGYRPWMARDFWAATGQPFSVAEYWDTNVGLIDSWISASGGGISVFDFPLYYTLQGVCNDAAGSAWLPDLLNPDKSYAARNPLRAVTFAANHDTDGIANDKMMAYAFILTYQGYPDLFWKDYFDFGLAHGGGADSPGAGNGIAPLVWCREKLAAGSPNIQVLKRDDGQLIAYASGGYGASQPGYVVVINSNPTDWKGARVQIGNNYLKNKALKAYAWSSTVKGQNYQPANAASDANGSATLSAPPRGYAVYSVSGL